MDGIGEVVINRQWDGFSTVILFGYVSITPHGDPLLSRFVGLQQAEAKLIKVQKSYVIVQYYEGSKEKNIV